MTDHDDTRGAAAPPPPMARQRVTGWLDDRLTRLGVTGRFGRDCVLALVVTIVTLLLFSLLFRFVPQEQGESLSAARSGGILATVAVQSSALCLRRVRPYVCLALTVGCQIAIIAAAPDLSLRGLAPIIAVYTIGSLTTTRAALIATVVAAGAEGVAGALVALVARAPTDSLNAVDPLLFGAYHLAASASVYLVAAFVGSYVATRRRYLQMVRTQAAEAVRAQQVRLRATIVAERSRLARELHDVAAHHLSSMVVQAAAVERLIDRDASAAKAGAAWIRRQGRETLDNIRQVVGLLRDQDGAGDDGNAPVPGLAALGDLVQTARDLGTEVDLVREGTARPLPPIADISLYRVAQQALTNARQHAPGAPVLIRLAYSDRDVVLDIVNGSPARGADLTAGPHGGTGTHGGTGLVGMRERADLVGAELTVGPTAGIGWRVRLRLPVTGPGPDEAGPRDAGPAGHAADAYHEADAGHAADADDGAVGRGHPEKGSGSPA